MQTIGDRIKEKRKQLKLTQKDLGDMLHISQHTVMRWEKSKSAPSAHEVVELSKLFNVNTSWLLGEEDGKRPETEAGEDLDQIMRDLASVNPDIVIRFRNMRTQWPELTKSEKRFILDGMMLIMGKAGDEVDLRLKKEGRKGKV